MPSTLHTLMTGAMVHLFPEGNLCHLCGRALLPQGEYVLCGACQAALDFGRIEPKEQAVGMHSPLTLCAAAYWHQDEARELVHMLKYQSNRAAAIPLGIGMAGAFANCPEAAVRRADVLVPVPLHAERLRVRGYNQALLLAQELSSHTGLPVLPDALMRAQATQTQVRKTREQRLSDMRSAFACGNVNGFSRRCVLLVDDVLTTGATAVACAEALLAGGAAEVALLTACRA